MSGASQRNGARRSATCQRHAASADAVANTTASAIHTIRLSASRAVTSTSASRTMVRSITYRPPPKPVGAGASSVSSSGATSTT